MVPTTHDAIIMAAASPPGRSARAIVRLSGPALSPLCQQLFDRTLPPRELTPCRLHLDASRSVDLPVLAIRFAGPASFTGEDVLEIQLPGNPALIARVLRAVAESGRATGQRVGLAEPGEFTRRAFGAGRIDLTEAEGIAATIGAVSDAQLAAAGLLRRGRLGRWSVEQADALAHLLALVEAGIDFVDQDDVVAIAPIRLADGLGAIDAALGKMLASSRAWSTLDAVPWVVMVGPPNAGKSTLFNALLGRQRAVTSDVAGTTRDVLAEPLTIETADGQRAEVMLADAAGLGAMPSDGAGPLDEAMQAAAHEAADRADLLLLVDEATVDRAAFVDWLAALGIDPARRPHLHVGAKADLGTDAAADLNVSARAGEGLDGLRQAIASRLADRATLLAGEKLALQPRHRHELTAAREALARALAHVEPQRDQPTLDDAELIAATLRQALDRLGELAGQMTPDDVLGRVFATFCIGK